ncbi:MAG TPA: right-handed parallel beta-helix repeat-containing protein [Candidatus Dormibacteraeota bacterium]|nr:right-handed parallel beta-helix repeat-containing protein [Candidatus Dormibacteraeota bacterium]
MPVLRRLSASLLGLAAVVGLASAAAGKRCGDDVDGADVPCACGDEVVASTVLGNDPVIGATCPYDGLLIRAAGEGASLELDLAGHTLRGKGRGVGLRVLDGGPGGASIVSRGGPGALEGFDDGIVARGRDGVALVQDLAIRGSRRDGLRVTGRDFAVRRVTIAGAHRDGFALGGTGFEISDTRAEDCGRFGYLVMGDSGVIGGPGNGNTADRSGMAGFNLMGIGHTLADCAARGGRKDGVVLQASQLDVRGCQALDNSGDGITGTGSRLHLADNQAVDNGGDGVAVRGQGLIDGGGNRGAGNRGAGRERAAVQCVIGGAPCTL